MCKPALYLIVSLFLASCADKTDTWLVIQGETMGTYYSVTYRSTEIDVTQNKVNDQIESILGNINQRMSTYISDSELSLFNQHNTTSPVIISNELFFVLRNSHKISEQTDGAFDITVGPLVNAWGFGPNPLEISVPTDEQIRSLAKQVGYKKLLLDESTTSVSKLDVMMYIDLSAIAKGYAVDRIAKYLDKLNIENYLIDIGGELIGRGSNENGQPWQIGIEKPNPLARDVQRIVRLDNMALATSGDYRNYFEQNGVRYSHTIDPTTGKPVTHTLASVSVLNQQSMLADAYATAFMVMGPEKSLALANRLRIPLYMIVKTTEGFDEQFNQLFSINFTD